VEQELLTLLDHQDHPRFLLLVLVEQELLTLLLVPVGKHGVILVIQKGK
jgi:hypothetical protein